jgi:hypothetical protein
METGPEWIPGQKNSAWRRNHLLVDAARWGDVAGVLARSDLPILGETTRYGLVRVDVGDQLENALHALWDWHGRKPGSHRPFGRNRFFGVDGESVGGAPKTFGSPVPGSTPQAAGERLPRRNPIGAGRGVTVGVADTGFWFHPWLAGACQYDVPSDDAIDADADNQVDAVAGHGTFIAGLVVQQAPGALVRVRRVIDTVRNEAQALDVHDAICSLADLGTDVINLSLGCYTDDDEEPFVLRHALDYVAATSRSLVVAAAGNGHSDRPFWPAASDRVWGVRAEARIGEEWCPAAYSGRGPWVDLAAPGDSVLSTYVQLPPGGADPNPPSPLGPPSPASGAWAYWSGASFAAAVASGWLAARKAEWLRDGGDQATGVDGRPASFLGTPVEVGGAAALKGYGGVLIGDDGCPLVGADGVRLASG